MKLQLAGAVVVMSQQLAKRKLSLKLLERYICISLWLLSYVLTSSEIRSEFVLRQQKSASALQTSPPYELLVDSQRSTRTAASKVWV